MAKSYQSKVVHLIILASTGGVHSHIEHLLSCIQHIRQQDKRIRIAVHAITDGRDRPPRAFRYIKPILKLIDEDSNIVLSTIIGRYAMDRDGMGQNRSCVQHSEKHHLPK